MRALPDGYTLLNGHASNAINTTLYNNLKFDFTRDIAPVASVSRGGGVMEVNPSVPAKTVPEFIAYAKANPGKINMASPGPGSAPGLRRAVQDRGRRRAGYSELSRFGPRASRSPCRSGAGHVRRGDYGDWTCESGQGAGAGGDERETCRRLPDIPTVGEFVPGYEATGWQGIAAPRDTPPEIITILNREVHAGLADPRFGAPLTDLGFEPFANSPPEFGKFIVDYTEKWGKVIRAANIKAE